MLGKGGVQVAVVEDADTLKLAFFIHVIKHALVHNRNIALFPQGALAFRRITENVELGNKFYKELATGRHESAQV